MEQAIRQRTQNSFYNERVIEYIVLGHSQQHAHFLASLDASKRSEESLDLENEEEMETLDE